MRCSWKWVVLWSLWAARLVRQPTMPLRVSGGWLRGQVAHDGSHARYLGVPYATLRRQDRFQNPQPAKWDGILDLYNENARCIQRFSKNMIAGTEDCLTLSIYTPLKEPDKLRPVMVYIHGGGFRDGSGSPLLYGPDYLIRHDVVLVTVNYRLEILGFLCLGIKEAPGNAGLKDQVEALRWIKKNINLFGGDPDNVTIFGESAGSASVLFHLTSPMSIGLFQRAIMQSGSIAPWSFQFEPLKTAILLAKHMGYHTEDPKELYDIFITKTAEELLNTRVPRVDGEVVLSENIFVPCAEKKLDGIEAFLEDNPFNLLVKGKYMKIPVIMGYNNAEGLMFIGKENDTTIQKLNFYKALPRDLQFPTEDDKIETARKLQQLYMGNEKISKKTLVKFAPFEGDSGIVYPVIATIELLLKTSNKPVYVYRFSHDGWMNLAKIVFGYGREPGATHADEIFYIFKPRATFVQSFFEMNMIDRMSTLWTNFAKYSDPTPDLEPRFPIKWEPADKRDPRLLVIDKEFSTDSLWSDDIIRFWNTTYTKFRRKM